MPVSGTVVRDVLLHNATIQGFMLGLYWHQIQLPFGRPRTDHVQTVQDISVDPDGAGGGKRAPPPIKMWEQKYRYAP